MLDFLQVDGCWKKIFTEGRGWAPLHPTCREGAAEPQTRRA